MQIGIIGMNHKQADVSLRELMAKACQRRFSLGAPIENCNGLAVLSTCNRSEIYFSGEDLAAAHTSILAILREEIEEIFEQKCYSFFGSDCLLHLSKVACGLDSALAFETEIQGQVKVAYELAAKTDLSPALHFLFQKSLSIGKEIRTLFPITKSVPDLEHAVLYLAKEYLPPQTVPLFIGSSEINIKIARFLKYKGIQKMTFCNRTQEKAQLLADEFQGAILPWEALQQRWTEFDWIISATKSPTHILSQNNHNSKKLFIDLSVPRNISPELARNGSKLFNIDAIHKLLEERKVALEQVTKRAELFLFQACTRKLESYELRTQCNSYQKIS